MKNIYVAIISIISALALSYFLYTRYYLLREAKYEFIGKFDYKITNIDSLELTYLSKKSFGFIIGNLPLWGIIINDNNIELAKEQEYVFSLNHPIKAVYTNSKTVLGEGQEHLKKKPVEIIQDTAIDQKYIYVYRIEPAGMYRLLLP